MDQVQTKATKLIAAVNGFAALLHLLFWIFAFVRLSGLPAHPDIATTYGFGIADLLWSVPLLLTGSFVLLRSRPIGWLAAQMANVLYWYSLTVVIVRDVHAGAFSPGTILFLPFTLFAFWAAYYLWKNRLEFLT
jgi:hypothetical protein